MLTLEGLLGKHFTATYDVSGYSYRKFRELNKIGRFVVLLDGFDEMKQMLSWREFKYNIRQLNQLYEGDSRLIILGRPTAFETDEEHQNILHGVRIDKLGTHRDPDWPDYFEVELSPLDQPEMGEFLRRYLTYRNSPIAADPAQFADLWDRVVSRQLKDIARRPVQLRMLAEVLPGYTRDLDELNVTRVYDIFITKLIDDIIAREDEKYSRLTFSSADRRRFLTEFAFWPWQGQDGAIVNSDQVPLELVRPFARGEDLEAVRRDLIVGSPLDRRLGERIRFPHRSFQEFLVAEAIWDKLRDGKLSLDLLAPLLSDEVGNFMKMQRGRHENDAALRCLPQLRGLLPWQVVDTVLLDGNVIQSILPRVHNVKATARRSSTYRPPTPGEVLLLTCWTSPGRFRNPPFSDTDLVALATADGSDEMALTCLFCCLMLGRHYGRFGDAAVLELLGLLISHENDAVRFTGETINRTDLRALQGGYIGRRRAQAGHGGREPEIGRVVGRGQIALREKGKRVIIGAEHLEVRWTAPAAAEVMHRLQIGHGGSRIDLRSLRSVFAAMMPEIVFIKDWIYKGALDSSIPLVETVSVGAAEKGLIDRIAVFRRAYDELTEIIGKSPEGPAAASPA